MKKLFLLLLSFIFIYPSFGQKKIYTTQRINPAPPVIDGILTDHAWEKVPWGEQFIMHSPYDDREPSQQTAFKILYDDDFLYVAIRAFDSEPDSIVTRMARRDHTEGDDVGILVDSYFDHMTAFAFFVNSAGVKWDALFSENGESEDATWDPVWYVKTSIDAEGWNAEMKIPFTQIRFENQADMVWGLQVGRSLFRKQEVSVWQRIPKDAPGFIHLFGELHGITGITPRRQIEISPYTVAKTERFASEEGNPFVTGKSHGLNMGLDGKIGLTNNLTLDFTVNPDFGQVEADPSEVNLTAFETYFEEKRPFFIEGKNIFNFSLIQGNGHGSAENLFYSRRIGRRPHHEPELDDDEYADIPENTPILGALKLTGKTKNGWSVGFLESMTSMVEADIDRVGIRSDETVEPFTNYFAGRVKKDIHKGNTVIGGMFTSTHRNIQSPGLEFLHRSAYTGGINFSQHWKDKTYYAHVKSYFSHVMGEPEAILETQTSSARYFQRPDADYVSVDSSRTSLSGSGGLITAGKQGNGKFMYSLTFRWKSPGLELNDMGYMRNADNINQSVWIGYRKRQPFSIFRNFGININQNRVWDFGGTNTHNSGNIDLHMQFKNYWGLGTGSNIMANHISNTELRGGPSIQYPGGIDHWIFLGSDSRKKVTLGLLHANYWGNFNAARAKFYHVEMTYRPTSALKISLNPSMEQRKDILQYIDEIDDRYLFGTIRQKTVSASIRINYSLTPDVSLQFWGQPFISVADYSEFKKITDPQASDFTNRFEIFSPAQMSETIDGEDITYHIDDNGDQIDLENPDFNFREFRSNMVLRWEYTPGSTVYLVWSQGRSSDVPTGMFDFKNDTRGMFRAFPHNVFLIKLSYRFKN